MMFRIYGNTETCGTGLPIIKKKNNCKKCHCGEVYIPVKIKMENNMASDSMLINWLTRHFIFDSNNPKSLILHWDIGIMIVWSKT